MKFSTFVILMATAITLVGCGKSDARIVAEKICHNAINPENIQYKPGSRGEMRYKIDMQQCSWSWKQMFDNDPKFLAREKAAMKL